MTKAGAPDPDPDALRAQVAAQPYWYHRIKLPGDVETPGWAPLRPASYGIPARMDGLRVLDVGAWDGYWTFEALKRGAAEVVAIDNFSDTLGYLDVPPAPWKTFDLCRDALGYDDGCCTRQELDVYDVDADTLGRFDVVFLFGVLYHLRYPLLALDRLSAVCTGRLFVETAILDDYSPYRGGLGRGYPDDDARVAEFYPGEEYGGNASNWWVPTLACARSMVAAAGFTQVDAWKLTHAPSELAHCRGFVVGTKADGAAAASARP